jgi:paraquat-inducible protein A
VFSAAAWLAVLIATVISFALANAFPVATLYVQGAGQAASFMDAVVVTWNVGYPEVAAITFAAGFFLPACQLGLLVWIFSALALGRLPLFFESAIDWVDRLKPWCMIPVFLMGVMVAVVKLAGLASLTLGIGLFATATTAILITALTRLNSEKIRSMAHDLGLPAKPAPVSKPPSPTIIMRTWALMLGAAILYIPANMLPIMKVSSLGSDSAHTILGGVIELWHMGSWDIALVVFIASVVVPLFKLVALAMLVFLTQQRTGIKLRERTHLYVIVEFIGQWSMLDVFVVILLSALGHFGSLLSIEPGGGAAAFGGVVILTMIAAMGFDPRLPWRLAGHRKHLTRADFESSH